MSLLFNSENLPQAVIARIRSIANRPSRDRGYTRTYYSYPAKFLSYLPRELTKKFSVKDDVIYDAYCGGGTTGLEAMLLERKSVGYDINPFAILIAKVKTRRLDLEKLRKAKHRVVDLKQKETRQVFDTDDEALLGRRVSLEVSKIAANIDQLEGQSEYRDFFRLALIHSIKIIGRRDFKGRLPARNQSTLLEFGGADSVVPPGSSILPSFKKKVDLMITQMATLPASKKKYVPEFVLGFNTKTFMKDESVDLIITSPPYKDLDVEYMQIQIQRRESHRSKRSDVIARILGVPTIEKDAFVAIGEMNIGRI